ncbi:hypothetical protein JOM56_012561 [Amanita muscaria]
MNMVQVGEQRSVTVAAQVSELNLIRQALYDLESAHNKIRQQYDKEIARLRADVAQQAQVAAVQQQQQQQQQHVHPSQSQASLPPPPPPPPPPPSSSQPGSGTIEMGEIDRGASFFLP